MDQEKERRSRLQKLSKRQLEVLRLRCQGYSLKEIATELVIVEATVDYHMRRIYRALELDGLPERSRPIELGRYCDLLTQVDEVLDEVMTVPVPIVEEERLVDELHGRAPANEDEAGWRRAGLAVVEDERRLTNPLRPDIVIRHDPIVPPPLPTRIPRSIAIVIIVGIALIAGLAGALAMLLLRPAPEPQVVMVVPTPAPTPLPVQPVETSRPTATTPPAPQVLPSTPSPQPTSVPSTATSVPPTLVAQLPAATQAPPSPTRPAATPVPVTNTVVPPTPIPSTPTPQAPSPTPRPQPGTVLYEANWSGGRASWSGGSEWRAVNGMLVNNGSASWTPSIALAPFRGAGDDYIAEAEIQQIDGHGFGVIARVDEGQPVMLGNGYNAGFVSLDGACIYLGAPGWSLPLGKRDFTAGGGWHVYRFEVKGNVLRLLIDGGLMVERTDNRFLTGPSVGIWSVAAQINVRKFRLISQ